MKSVVEQLIAWVRENSITLETNGIQVIEGFPKPDSIAEWKANVSLAYNGILVSYTVWERLGLQTELIVMNASTKKTIIMDDNSTEDPQIVRTDLDGVLKKLL